MSGVCLNPVCWCAGVEPMANVVSGLDGVSGYEMGPYIVLRTVCTRKCVLSFSPLRVSVTLTPSAFFSRCTCAVATA